MEIKGNQLGDYVNKMIERMGFKSGKRMFFADQLWRARFGNPFPLDYYNPRDCHLLGLDADCELIERGLTFVI